MKRIFAFLKPYRWRIVQAMLLIAASTICELLLPTLMSQILDHGVRESDFELILRCCGVMLVTALTGFACLLGGRRISSALVAEFSGDLRAAVFHKVNTMTFEEFDELGTAALITRSTHDIETVSWVASMISGSLITIPVLFVGGIVLAMGKDVRLSLIMLAFVPLVFLVVLLVGRNIRPLHEKSDHYIDIQNDIMRERLHGIRVIRAFNKEQEEQDKIADATRVMAENIINANVRMGLVSPLAVLLLNISVVLILWVGAFNMEHGLSGVSGGDVFAIIQYIALVSNGVVMAGMALVMIPHAQVAAERIGQVFEAQGLTEPALEEEREFCGDIVLDHVSFRYEGAAEEAVSDVSLTIKAGQRVAILGGTGSGKSTLVQLLMAFHLPTGGQIRFDGVPADCINRRIIRRNMSCVLQKTAIYSGTVESNIRMGRPEASREEVRAAAEIAQLGHFIDGLPEGMEHELTQSGKNLSGGQKQRLCIARAILKDAPIYLFDDSFSALDFLTEANLRRELNEKIKGKTQIVITQRISSAMSSDCIFVMDKGRLVDSGSHAELLERCGIYREIYASQTGGDCK